MGFDQSTCKDKKKRKTESGKRKTFLFFGFRLEWKTDPTLRSERRGQIYLHYAEPRGGKAHEEGLTENGKHFVHSKIFVIFVLWY